MPALARKPEVLLVDELAHSNAPGSRNTKRYQDVEEVLRAGISVWTTVNVQHLESLNDLVASITDVAVRRTGCRTVSSTTPIRWNSSISNLKTSSSD